MNLDDYKKAGKIAAEARDYSKKIVKADESVLETTEKIEKKIIDLGGKLAFPVDMSINNIAAHYSAFSKDTLMFKEEDLVKVDIGVHINGAVADTAITVDLGDHKEMVEAAEKALNNALKIIEIGTKLSDIGEIIQKTIQEYNYSPIRNLSGHGMELYKVHAEPSIPNVKNNDPEKLKEGMVIAVEPFATNGTGLVIEGKPSEIYELIEKKPTRNQHARKILAFVEQEYKTLPFNKRWLLNKFNAMEVNLGLMNLEREQILHQYSILPEKNNGLVSQAEHTILIRDKPIITTKI